MAEPVTSARLYTSGAVAPCLKNKLFSTAEGQSKLSGIEAWGWVCMLNRCWHISGACLTELILTREQDFLAHRMIWYKEPLFSWAQTEFLLWSSSKLI